MYDEKNLDKLFDVVYEIRDRVTRIEERQTRIEAIEEKAERADATAREALQLAKSNAEQINRISATTKWALGIVASAAIAILALIFR